MLIVLCASLCQKCPFSECQPLGGVWEGRKSNKLETNGLPEGREGGRGGGLLLGRCMQRLETSLIIL